MSQYGRQDSNPNTVLVVFLVLFVLLSIGLGVWGYLGFQSQEELRKKIAEQQPTVEAAKEARKYSDFVSKELRAAVGDTLSADELADWLDKRDAFLKEGGTFGKDEPTRPAVEGLIKKMKAELGATVDPSKQYDYTFEGLVAKLKAERNKAQSDSVTANKESLETNQILQKRKELFEKKMDEFKTKIAEDQKELVDMENKRFAAVKAAIDSNAKLAQQLKDDSVAYQIKLDDLEKERNSLKDTLDRLTGAAVVLKDKKSPNAADIAPTGLGFGDSGKHGMMFDVSRGKPMWDEARGKIKSVTDRKVIISLGYEDGIRPGLTFNVFAGKYSHPSKELKGTIEVLRDIKRHSAEALITEQYDAKNNAIHEDDLLFNMVWGTHVVVAGQINWFGLIGTRAENAAEQVRNLDQFLDLLRKQGVIVDAYVDLTDGSVKGTITRDARFLIRGQSLYQKKYGSQAGEKDDDGDTKKGADENAEPKMLSKMKEIAQKRISDINASMMQVRNQCVDRGMFIISAENFAHVAGIHKFRATNGPEAPRVSTELARLGRIDW